MSKSLNLEIWRKIYSLISKNPGADIQKIIELANLKPSVVETYIESMEKHGEIHSTQENDTKHFFPGEQSLLTQQDRRVGDTRIQMYSLIMQNPGLHLSKIAELLDMSSPLAEYHLSYLEKHHYVMSVADGKGYYKRYYIKYSDVGVEEKQSLAVLRQEPLLKIVLLLIRHQSLQHKEIADKLGIAPSTLSYHLNKLVESQLIEVVHHGEEKGYTLKDTKEIVWLVRRYKLDQLIEGFKDVWNDLDLF